MSVMILSNNHINAIVQYAEYCKLGFWFKNNYYQINNKNDAAEIAKRLMNANIKSYNKRYNDNALLIEKFKFGFNYKYWLTGIALYKICDAYAYNTCEMPLWDGSIEKAFIEAVKKEALQRSEEYNQSQWTI